MEYEELFIMIKVCEPFLTGNELNYVCDCIESNNISSQGKYVGMFEEEWARYCGQKYGIATTSGTTALHLAMAALNIGPGDEVIVPTFTMAATAFAVSYMGATPVFIDCCIDTFNINPISIKRKITARTKAIIAVHLYGHPCDMDSLLKICKEYNLFLVEDAAEAHGATYKDKKVGAFGDIACFSFYANKIITTGEGGMCLTSDPLAAERMRSLRNLAHSKDKRFWHSEVGYNFRLTSVQAAIGLAQFEKIDFYIQRRKEHAELYTSLLKDLVETPVELKDTKRVYWMYTILLPKRFDRNTFMDSLYKREVETRASFFPMTNMSMYRCEDQFPIAQDISKRGLYLPSGSGLNNSQIEYVSKQVKELLK
jgi:perosamine synthetase